MKKLYLFIVLLMLATAAFSSDDQFVVGMELEFPPFETVDVNGNPEGVSVEISKLLAKELGRDLRIENMAYSGLIPALVSGKIDAIISSMGVTEERSKRVDFSDPYAYSQLVLLANKDSKVDSYRDLDNKDVIIAVRTGTIGHLWANKNAPRAQLRLFDKESQAVLDVSQRKSDVFIYDPQSVVRRHKRNPTTTRVLMDPLPGVGGWGIAVQKGDEELLKKINAFLEKAMADGTFDRIREKYLKEDAEQFEAETGLEYFF